MLNKQQMIDEIMNEFNFERVQTVMKTLDWKWCIANEMDTRVPTLSEIRKQAKELMENAVIRGGIYGTGGFQAKYTKKGNLSLKFILMRWDVYKDE